MRSTSRPQRTLVITALPPAPTSAAAEALAKIIAFRHEGDVVRAASLTRGAVTAYDLATDDWRSILRFLSAVSFDRFDRLVFYYAGEFTERARGGRAARIATYIFQNILSTSLGVRFRGRFALTVHAFDTVRLQSEPQRRLHRRLLRAATHVEFKSRPFRDLLLAKIGLRDAQIETSGSRIERRKAVTPFLGTRTEARRTLGLPQRDALFVAVGSLTEGQGRDLVESAFRQASCLRARLHLLHPGADRLTAPNDDIAAVHSVPDAHLSTWMTAADALLLSEDDEFSLPALSVVARNGVSVFMHRSMPRSEIDVRPGTRPFYAKNDLARLFSEIDTEKWNAPLGLDEDTSPPPVPDPARKRIVLVTPALDVDDLPTEDFASLLADRHDVEIWTIDDAAKENGVKPNDISVRFFKPDGFRIRLLWRQPGPIRNRISQRYRATTSRALIRALDSETNPTDLIVLMDAASNLAGACVGAHSQKTAAYVPDFFEECLTRRPLRRRFDKYSIVIGDETVITDTPPGYLPSADLLAINHPIREQIKPVAALPAHTPSQRNTLIVGRAVVPRPEPLRDWAKNAITAHGWNISTHDTKDFVHEFDDGADISFETSWAYIETSGTKPILMLTAWLAGCPVIAHGSSIEACLHIARSGGGIIVNDPSEMTAALKTLIFGRRTRDVLGERGRHYVLRHYHADLVGKQIQSLLDLTASNSL